MYRLEEELIEERSRSASLQSALHSAEDEVDPNPHPDPQPQPQPHPQPQPRPHRSPLTAHPNQVDRLRSEEEDRPARDAHLDRINDLVS